MSMRTTNPCGCHVTSYVPWNLYPPDANANAGANTAALKRALQPELLASCSARELMQLCAAVSKHGSSHTSSSGAGSGGPTARRSGHNSQERQAAQAGVELPGILGGSSTLCENNGRVQDDTAYTLRRSRGVYGRGDEVEVFCFGLV
ncbi:hypothetical protein HaLaN_19483 [Haematococcus lacustris]|uniref:Uncharacterized protein n=1 Tax=Haematococcus lacustris TaxID=44745 RepID=A0A699ZTS3_HAELA|nr:hypothetical protein HaLaN_19483 [Haematococcus lacustris]